MRTPGVADGQIDDAISEGRRRKAVPLETAATTKGGRIGRSRERWRIAGDLGGSGRSGDGGERSSLMLGGSTSWSWSAAGLLGSRR
jgi:hypothetical protein